MTTSTLYYTSLPNANSSLPYMRRDTSASTVVWAAEIEQSTIESFESRLPMNGARAWVIARGTELFLDFTEHSPRLQKKVRDDLQRMLHAEKRTGLTKINLRLPRDIYERFNRVYPEWGMTSWMIRHIMESMTSYMSTHNISMDDLLTVCVGNILRDQPQQVSL